MWQTGNPIVDQLARIREYGLEFTHRRFYSKYKGTVETNYDLQQQGRIKVSVPDLGNLNIPPKLDLTQGEVQIQSVPGRSASQTLDLYAYPSAQFAGDNYGMYFPPETGDPVWVWFEQGDPSQPHYSGSWWTNPGVNKAKTSDTSRIPAEFKNPLSFKPTARGIKTKRGHGLSFEDDADLGFDTGITIWTGESQVPASLEAAPLPAKKRHSITMSDRDEEIHIKTFGHGPTQNGHATIWDDFAASQGIRTTSIYGHTINIDDVTKSITISTKLGHKIILSDITNSITAQTVLGNKLILNDTLKTASLTTPLQQSVTLNDTALSTSVTTPGTVSVTAGAAATVTAGGAATISAAGALALTGTGLTITSAGAGPSVSVASGISTNSFTGLVTENYNGALTQIVVGGWSMNAGIMNLTSVSANILAATLLSLGSLTGTKLYLVTENFIDAFNAHTHPTAALGPPSVPSTIIPKAPPYVTSSVKAD